MRVKEKVAIVVGGGQIPGGTIGNGRATAILFGREGAKVMVVDRNLNSAQDTVSMIVEEGGIAKAVAADVTDEASLQKMIAHCVTEWGRIDILHNNVGFSLGAGDAVIEEITSEAFDRIMQLNLRGMVMTCKHVLPIMRKQRSGVIISISSHAVLVSYPYVAYKASKAGVIAMTEQLADMNAEYGIRANAILPGLMNTPMAIESRIKKGKSREEVIAERDAQVPLGKMGTAWDVGYAALFLASDEAKFISGVSLLVDGAASVRRG